MVFAQNVSINDHRMVHTHGLASELVRRGHKVEVVINHADEVPQYSDTPYILTEIPGSTYSIKGQMEFSRNLKRLLGRREPDIIHAKNPITSALSHVLKWKKDSDPKLVYDMRGLWIDFGVHSGQISSLIEPLLKIAESHVMSRADAVIAISDELKKVLTLRGVNSDKISVIIGDGVDLYNLSNSEYQESNNTGHKTIGYLGGIGRNRSSEKIIEAFEILTEMTDTNIKLIMAGYFGEGEKEYFKRLVAETKFEDKIIFTGFIPNGKALRLLHQFDVAVAYHEGDLPIFNVAVPTKILEYMAAGRAIVTTNQFMYRNILTHGVNAYLTEQNPQSFAEGMLAVLENETLAKRLGEDARNMAGNYSFQRVSDQVEELYKKLVT